MMLFWRPGTPHEFWTSIIIRQEEPLVVSQLFLATQHPGEPGASTSDVLNNTPTQQTRTRYVGACAVPQTRPAYDV